MLLRFFGLTVLLALVCATDCLLGAAIPDLSDPQGQIIRLEYFYDQDPGVGNGVPVDFNTDAQGHIQLNLDLPLDGLSVGMHQLFIRAQNGRNEWSITSKHSFFLAPFATKTVPVIEKGEFFVGKDPGEGKGTSVLPADPASSVASFSVRPPSLPPGHHTLQFRAQDSFGNWSMPVKHATLQIPEIRATGVEWSVHEGEEIIATGSQMIDPPASRFTTELTTPLMVDETFTERPFQAQARLILEERIPSFVQQFDLNIQALGDPLRILTPPQNQMVHVGDALRLNVVANKSDNLTYQWFKNGVVIPGATSATLTIQTIGLADAGTYAVSISDGVQETISDAAIVQVASPIENAPPTISLMGDATVELAVGGTYTEPGFTAMDPEEGDLTNQVSIDGEVNTSVPGTYLLNYSVSDKEGLSATTTRTVQVIPSDFSILSGPVTNETNGNQYYLLSAGSWTESEAFAHELGGHLTTIRNTAEQEWIWDTFSAFGGTERSLWIGLNDQDQEGSFQWASGEALDFTHWLDGQPDDNPASGGEDYVHIVRRGNAFNAVPGFWNDLADTDAVFDQFSPIHGVVEVVPFQILSDLSDQSVQEGESVALEIQVSDPDKATYQWFKDDSAISDANGARYLIDAASVSDAGSYHVQIEHPQGTLTSRTARFTVEPSSNSGGEPGNPPQITQQPLDRIIPEGTLLWLTVEVKHDGPVTYQWKKGRTDLDGSGTTSSLYLGRATPDQNGEYRVVIGYDGGQVESRVARVIVQAEDGTKTNKSFYPLLTEKGAKTSYETPGPLDDTMGLTEENISVDGDPVIAYADTRGTNLKMGSQIIPGEDFLTTSTFDYGRTEEGMNYYGFKVVASTKNSDPFISEFFDKDQLFSITPQHGFPAKRVNIDGETRAEPYFFYPNVVELGKVYEKTNSVIEEGVQYHNDVQFPNNDFRFTHMDLKTERTETMRVVYLLDSIRDASPSSKDIYADLLDDATMTALVVVTEHNETFRKDDSIMYLENGATFPLGQVYENGLVKSTSVEWRVKGIGLVRAVTLQGLLLDNILEQRFFDIELNQNVIIGGSFDEWLQRNWGMFEIDVPETKRIVGNTEPPFAGLNQLDPDVEVFDGLVSLFGFDEVVLEPDQPPVLNGGEDLLITKPTNVEWQFEGRDPDSRQEISYHVHLASGLDARIDRLTGAFTLDVGSDISDGDYTITIRATEIGPYSLSTFKSFNIAVQMGATVVPVSIVSTSGGKSVTEGESVDLGVQVSGTEPIEYQWTFNGQAIDGANLSTLTIPSANPKDEGIYRVQVSNAGGSVLSDPIEVKVIPLPAANTKPTINLAGEATMRIDLGSVFQEPGFAASDEEDGDITHAVTISGMVNTSFPGTYTLEYAVADAGGLTAVVTREVIVRAPASAPSGMVLVEDLGPVGIGADNANLSLETIDSFYMDVYEVSKGLWDEVREWGLENGYGDLSEGRAGQDGDATHPVTEVSWLDAVKWCNARSEKEGLRPAYYLDEGLSRVFRNREEVMLHLDRSSGYRLPTLIEWEKAARGDLYVNSEKTQGYDYPWASNEKTPEDANYWPNLDNTTPVGSYAPNGYGLYDMSGNVWEFCWDPITTNQGDIRLTQRHMRGGGWDLSSKAAVFSQFTPPVDDKYNFLGFRSVLPPQVSGPGDELGDIQVTLLTPTNEVPSYRLAWNSVSGVSYMVESVSELGEAWTEAISQPVVAVSDQAEWAFDVEGPSRFFRVRANGVPSGGGVRNVNLTPFPQDGAFSIPPLASISMDLPDHEAIDTSTIRLTVGSLGTFGVDHPALTFDQGMVTFDPSLAGALGDPEEMVSAQVKYADPQGNQYAYDWSFRIQKQTILSGDVFVLGSPQAQFQGQALNPRQQMMYEQLGMSPSAFSIRQQTGNAPWSLETVTDDALVFSYQGDTPPNFKVGQFLTNLTPAKKDEIFYRKVVVVLKDVPEKQKMTVFTEDVGLLEIFVQASMLSHPVGFPAAAYAIAQEGFLVNASQGFLLESPIEETWSPEEGVDLTLSGNISIEPKLSLSLDIQGSKVEDFYLRQEGEITQSLGASLKVTESHKWETKTKDPIFSTDRVFYLGQVGVVPIWLDLEFEVNAEAEASYEASGEISTGIQKTYHYWSELVYSERNPSLNGMFASPPSRNLEVTPLSVTIEGHAEAAVRLVPELSMELESLFGVRVDLTPEVGLKGDVTFANDKMESAAFELYGRLDLNAGLSIEGIDDDLLPEIEPIELVYFPWTFLYPGFQFEITRQPEGGRFTEGEDVTLSVDVAVLHESFDPDELRYQWFKDGTLLSNQTGPVLSISPFSESEAGEYWVEVWKDGGEERVVSDIVRVAEGIRWGNARLVELKTIKGASTFDFSEFTVSKPPQDLVELPSINWNRLTSTFNPIAISYDHEGMQARLGSGHWLSQLELENWEDFLRALGFDENDALPSRFAIPDRSGVKPEAMSLGEVFTYLSTNRAASKENDPLVRIHPHSEKKPTFVYEIYVTPDGEVPTFTGSGGGFATYVDFDATQGNPDENAWTVLRRTAAVTFEDDQVVLEENDDPSVFGIADGNGLVTNPIDLSHPLDLGIVKHASYLSGAWSISSDTFSPSGIHTYDYEVTVYVVADDENQTDQWYLDQFKNLVQELQ